METLQNISRPVTYHEAVLEDKACKGLIPALETAILVYDKLASRVCDPHVLDLLHALEAEKKTQRVRLRALVDGQPLLEVTLSDLLWDRLDDIAASVAGAGQFLAEAEVLAFAMSMEETVWQAYLQACLATVDNRAKLLATQLSEQQAQLARTVATRIRRLKGGFLAGSWRQAVH